MITPHLPRRRQWPAWVLFGCAVTAVTAGDLWSKAVVFEALAVQTRPMPPPSGGDPRPRVVAQDVVEVIPGFFELEANYNYGAFSGWFARHTGVLTVISALAVAFIVGLLVVMLRSPRPPAKGFVTALALICGGTLGNFYDRIALSAVRDWIKWFVVIDGREHVWPNFNIADSAICVGVSLIVLFEIIGAIRERRGQPATEAAE